MSPRGIMSLCVIAGVGAIVIAMTVQARVPHTGAPSSARAASPAPEYVRGIGYTEPSGELRRLSFQVDGIIAECPVEPGQRVAAGDVLMRLRTEERAAEVATAAAECDRAQRALDQLLAGTHPDQIVAAERLLDVEREKLSHAKKEQKRVLALTERNITTQLQIDDAETAVRQAELLVSQQEAVLASLRNSVRETDRLLAEAEVRLADARLKLAQERLDLCTLTAPFDGMVLDVLKREGDGLRMGDNEPVIIFGDLSDLVVRAEIDERYVRRLRPGQAAKISGTNLGDEHFSGRVTLVKPVLGPKTVFTRSASERKDLDVIEVIVALAADVQLPVGLRVDVAVDVSDPEVPHQSSLRRRKL